MMPRAVRREMSSMETLDRWFATSSPSTLNCYRSKRAEHQDSWAAIRFDREGEVALTQL